MVPRMVWARARSPRPEAGYRGYGKIEEEDTEDTEETEEKTEKDTEEETEKEETEEEERSAGSGRARDAVCCDVIKALPVLRVHEAHDVAPSVQR
uniref:Uncharacterized protein n=1 Tax=Knipowitschia caucasica TaxID=637954 RepID=A0AAV2KNL3_KNICA